MTKIRLGTKYSEQRTQSNSQNWIYYNIHVTQWIQLSQDTVYPSTYQSLHYILGRSLICCSKLSHSHWHQYLFSVCGPRILNSLPASLLITSSCKLLDLGRKTYLFDGTPLECSPPIWLAFPVWICCAIDWCLRDYDSGAMKLYWLVDWSIDCTKSAIKYSYTLAKSKLQLRKHVVKNVMKRCCIVLFIL